MPKTFYTERDIDDLFSRGVISLVVDDDVVLTDLAREKAMKLGLELVRENDKPPSAPERPYIAQLQFSSAAGAPGAAGTSESPNTAAAGPSGDDDLHKRVHEAVIARLGDSVDPDLLDSIIRRVLKNVPGR
jgi:hypothetical protein